MQKTVILIKSFWPLLLLTLIGIYFRTYKIEDIFYFTYDESIPAFVGKNLLESYKLPLIGGVTPFGVHLTPYFYWLMAGIIALGKLNPIYWGYLSALLSSITIILIYLTSKNFFNNKVAVLASVFWAFSYLANIYDRHFWALYWGPMLCLLTLISLKKIITGRKQFLFPLVVGLIWSISTDPSNLIFLFLTIFAYLFYKISVTKYEILAILVVIFSLSPLLLFDIRHNFANSKPFLKYLSSEKTESRFNEQSFFERTLIFSNSATRLIYPFTDNEVSKQYSYCESFVKEKYENVPYVVNLSTLFFILSFIVVSVRSNNLGAKLISTTIIFYFVGIQAYGILFNGDIFEHYLAGIFPLFLIIFAFYVSKLPTKIVLLLLSLFIFFNIYKLSTAQNLHGFNHKKSAIKFVTQRAGADIFSLDSVSSCWKYSGYRYLFAAFGKEPVKSYVDPNLSHLYGNTPVVNDHPQTVVSFFTHDFKGETSKFYSTYAKHKANEIDNAIFGNIEVIIMDNRTKWF